MPVFLCPVSRQASLQEELGIKKLRAAQQRLFFLDLDYGAQRKTRDTDEGNPQQGQLQVSSAAGQSQMHSSSGYFSQEIKINSAPINDGIKVSSLNTPTKTGSNFNK